MSEFNFLPHVPGHRTCLCLSLTFYSEPLNTQRYSFLRIFSKVCLHLVNIVYLVSALNMLFHLNFSHKPAAFEFLLSFLVTAKRLLKLVIQSSFLQKTLSNTITTSPPYGVLLYPSSLIRAERHCVNFPLLTHSCVGPHASKLPYDFPYDLNAATTPVCPRSTASSRAV
jgi:hypothetical protein